MLLSNLPLEPGQLGRSVGDPVVLHIVPVRIGPPREAAARGGQHPQVGDRLRKRGRAGGKSRCSLRQSEPCLARGSKADLDE